MDVGRILQAFRTSPPTPALGISTAEVLRLYPSAIACAVKPSFHGRVLRAESRDDSYHFVFVDDQLREAIYSTRWSSSSDKALGRKIKHFLNAYGGSDNFEVVLDNGFGYTIHRNDKAVWALYSYAVDVFSVGYMSNGDMVMLDWELRDEVT